MDNYKDTEDEDMSRLKKATEALGEHFDCVHIFASRYLSDDEGKTLTCSYGTGHWYARYGQIKEWIVKSDQRAIKDVNDEN
jgi:hypothetical protein